MAAADFGQAALSGWRQRVASAVATPVARRSNLDEDDVRVVVGWVFFALACVYVAKTLSRGVRR